MDEKQRNKRIELITGELQGISATRKATGQTERTEREKELLKELSELHYSVVQSYVKHR